jgi:hypothetical protein
LLFAFLYWNNYLFASVRFTYLPTLLRINSFYQMARRSQIWENAHLLLKHVFDSEKKKIVCFWKKALCRCKKKMFSEVFYFVPFWIDVKLISSCSYLLS